METQIMQQDTASRKSIEKRRKALRQIILEVRANPELRKEIKDFIEASQ